MRENLRTLRAAGACVAIDDFGTGYSSLSYLAHLPADVLKIDQAFIEGLDQSGERGLAGVVVRLGQTLGMDVVAEGVSRPSQLDAVRALGCRLAQGFLFSGPLASAEAAAWVHAERSAADAPPSETSSRRRIVQPA